MQLLGRRYDTGESVCLETAGARIVRLAPAPHHLQHASSWPWIAPGLLDLQVNGYGGQEFSDAGLTPGRVAEIAERMLALGVTRFCPTVTTQAFDVLCHALGTIRRACECSALVARMVAGVHLEGPYISPEDGPRGHAAPEHCRRPSWDELERLQEAAGGRIRLLTMGVEFDEAAAFIQKATAAGVVVGIGHTAADSLGIRRAVEAGARLSTHLGNGIHPILPRHPNYLWDQLAEDRLHASLVADGEHLPPEVLKVFIRAKTPSRCILVSDMPALAGLPHESPRTLGDGVANVMQFAGLDLATAVAMAAQNPANLLGVARGSLTLGEPADLVQFRLVGEAGSPGGLRFELCSTILGGQVAWGRPWQPD